MRLHEIRGNCQRVASHGGSYDEVVGGNRASLTPSKRDEAPFTEAQQADWFQFRREHSTADALALDGLSIEELLERGDGDLCEAINRRAADQQVRKGYWRLRRPVRNLYLLDRLYAEVQKGGFHHFFSTTAGDFADDTAEAIAEVGVPGLEAAFKHALSLWPNPPSQIHEDRLQDLAALKNGSETWTKSDKEFAKCSAGEGWQTAVAAYIRKSVRELELDLTEKQRQRAIQQVLVDFKPAPPVERLDRALLIPTADKRRERLMSVLQMRDTSTERKLHCTSMADRLEKLRRLNFNVDALDEVASGLPRVRHPKFGDGVIESQEGEKLVIRFQDGSVKKLAIQFVTRI